MSKALVLGALGAIVSVGCAAPGAGLVGRWEGVQECDGAFFDGSDYREGPYAHAIELDHDATGRLVQLGGCVLPLEVTTESRAEYVPTACTVTHPDLGPLLYELESGYAASATEDTIATAVSIRVTDEGGYGFTAVCDFDGVRAD